MNNVRRVALVSGLLVGMVAAAAGCLPAGATSRTFSVGNCSKRVSSTRGTGCGPALRALLERLAPGDRLVIAPGTYDVGTMMATVKATAARRITVAAQDPARRPVLRGWTVFLRSDYLTLSHVDFQAGVSANGALQFVCGVGWTVEYGHIFGAQQTKAFSNLFIGGRQPGPPNPDDGTECTSGPSSFMVRNNYFTAPYTEAGLNTSTVPGERTRGTEYHNVYVAFEGTARTGGTIEHNTFVGNKNGAGVKLQDGKYKTIGPWHVRVKYNTFVSGQRAIYLLNDVRYNTMVGNLIVDMSGGGGISGREVGVALYEVPTRTNTLSHTYAYNLTRVWATVKPDGSTLIDQGDNQIRSDPKFTSYALRPATPAAKAYGAFSPNSFG